MNIFSALKSIGPKKYEFRPTGTEVPVCRNRSSSEKRRNESDGKPRDFFLAVNNLSMYAP